MQEFACFTCGKATAYDWRVSHFEFVNTPYWVDHSDVERAYCSPECVRDAMSKEIAERAESKLRQDVQHAEAARKRAAKKLDLVLSYVPKKKRHEVDERLSREYFG